MRDNSKREAVPIIDLKRRFSEWTHEEPPDPDVWRAWGLDEVGVGWEQLLTKRRAVILAEAGSGKTTEFVERARLMALAHPYVFHASVEDVGREGLESTLTSDERNQLARWRQSTDDAWFFIDSVDEAKVAGIKFELVARKLAEAIRGAEERCYILLSGRVTDCEPGRDLDSLKKWLPVFAVTTKPQSTPEEELLRVIRSEGTKADDAPLQAPFVAIMVHLDRQRIRQFAEALGAPSTGDLLKAIEEADLWHFARRPRDLDWLVRFWQAEGRLGTLKEMLERSVTELLKEPNHDRRRGDDLDGAKALHAVERIGAAMVFGRKATVAIPDRDAKLVSDTSLNLEEILPDLSSDDHIRLLTRPIFDPATFGRVRFHNDNEGTIRSFLAARWLVRLREANLSTAELFRLLFATSYGLEVIRPSLNETTAWLCLWDRDVANEVVRRAPNLLLSFGDPASLSVGIRSAALTGLLRELTSDEQEWPRLGNDQLRRFAQSDLGDSVRSLWPQYRSDQEASWLLMRLIWLGALKECRAIAREVAFDNTADPTLRIIAGNAWMALADSAGRHDYAELITRESAQLPVVMVRNAILDLFPTIIRPSDLLHILDILDVEHDRNGMDFGRDGEVLVKKLESVADLDTFLKGLIERLHTELGDHAHYPQAKREEVFFPAMAEAALRLLNATSSDAAPDAAVDALLRIGNRRDHASGVRKTANEALVELHWTAARRRHAFWRVVATLRTASRTRPVDLMWHIESLGYPPGLKIDDVEWLLTDGLTNGGVDCRLAINSALAIWRSQGETPSVLGTITQAVESDLVAAETFREWMMPREPFQAEMERDRLKREGEWQAEQDQRDQWWIRFIRDIRSDPERIARLRQPVAKDQPCDLLDLWYLQNLARRQPRYAIASVAPLERIAGGEVASAVEAGLIARWRSCEPMIRSRRTPQERNRVSFVEHIGLTGVTLEAKNDPFWATKLSSDEAQRAAEYALLEINDFPTWFLDLAKARPEQVRAVLHDAIKDELAQEGVTFFETLNAIASSDPALSSLMAPLLLADLEAGLMVPPSALSLVLRIVVNGLAVGDRERFERLAILRFELELDVSVAVEYLAAMFSINPKGATKIFMARAAALAEDPQTALVDRFLTACFGDSMSGALYKPITPAPAAVVEELMLLNFKTHKQVRARQRPSGVVYRSTAVDYADRARDAVFSRFLSTPGPATYHTLRRLQQDPTFPIQSTIIRVHAERRALEDSEAAPWPAGEPYAYEQSKETAPRTAKDLRSVLMGRIEDIQHELLNDDFSQRQTFKGLKPEREVQKWVADRLKLKQGRSFSVDRETHVIDEKEPDVRITAKASAARVLMEIKVAESWSLKELDDALEIQLCGQYLRSDQGRYGVLLLVHQEAKRWVAKTTGKYLSFPEVVAHLRARALAISGVTHDSPQAEVAVLDVT